MRVFGTWSSGGYRQRAHVPHGGTSNPKIWRRWTTPQEHSPRLEELEASISAFRNFSQVYNDEEFAQAIADRIEGKKTKIYHEEASYPIHLILHLIDCICEGDARQATRRDEHDPGRFAAIWCVHPVFGVWQI